MAFRLKRDARIGDEVKRIVGRPLELATTELRSIGDPRSDAAIHRARRRVKKIRAVIRLVRPSLGGTFQPINRRLRETVDLLAPVADGQGVVEALDRLSEKYGDGFAAETLATFRAGLVEREARADRQAKVDRVLQRVSATLRDERERVKKWKLKGASFKPLARSLETSCRAARKAMAATITHPTTDNFHWWRRHVKDHWFHVRLIKARCGNRLLAYERRLEALDDCLGEYHNFALLGAIVMAETSVPRPEAARRLRIIKKYQGELRRKAYALGRRIYAEKPRHFVRRVRALWRLTNVIHRAA